MKPAPPVTKMCMYFSSLYVYIFVSYILNLFNIILRNIYKYTKYKAKKPIIAIISLLITVNITHP